MAELYLRFSISQRHSVSGQPLGLFNAAWRLKESGALSDHEVVWWWELAKWFGEHLAEPKAARRSRRPHAPDRAIFWFRASAHEHIRRMREVATLLEEHGVPVDVHQTEQPGYIVYEDEFQVAAEPFADRHA